MLKTFQIDIDDFTEQIFRELGSIQDGGQSHVATFKAVDKEEAANEVALRLLPFITKQLDDYYADSEDEEIEEDIRRMNLEYLES